MSFRPANAQHMAFMADLQAALLASQDVPFLDLLALASQFVGRLIAIQDQTKYTPDQIKELMVRNIELGNADAIHRLVGNPAGNA